ncbi:DinB family protein [Mucilaginibacter sp. Bleaf8]|uniref:DinB family protein n=1 Tax=Mucilaginibacter sp. Bleaf8 TaxID=2834430 RepID=UPI001BCF899A|nr:DinB family protein [Mucilaginibacter sp. Bleaf8]MBS7565507.1 DinB family protein [Mucilaginibacter sp. Bleaf8]
MLKQYFTDLAAYNCWADQKVIDWLSRVDEEQWKRANVSSFPSLRQTALHIASAEKIWVDFWMKANDPVYLSAEFTGTNEELLLIWKEASGSLAEFVKSHPEDRLTELVSFTYPNGRTGRMQYDHTFAHSINHSTYHRGQLVTLLRQAGYNKFSSIDLATYYIQQSVIS